MYLDVMKVIVENVFLNDLSYIYIIYLYYKNISYDDVFTINK